MPFDTLTYRFFKRVHRTGDTAEVLIEHDFQTVRTEAGCAVARKVFYNGYHAPFPESSRHCKPQRRYHMLIRSKRSFLHGRIYAARLIQIEYRGKNNPDTPLGRFPGIGNAQLSSHLFVAVFSHLGRIGGVVQQEQILRAAFLGDTDQREMVALIAHTGRFFDFLNQGLSLRLVLEIYTAQHDAAGA